MVYRILIGVAAGALAGGLVGYAAKCRGGACPITGNPFVLALLGAIFGGLVAVYPFQRQARGGGAPFDVPTVATVQEFDQRVLKSPTPVLVDFFATWCGPCHELEPTLAALEAAYRGRVAFFRVDVDQAAELARARGIEAMPTVIVFRGGEPASPPLVGVYPERDYRAALDKALEK